MGNDEGKSANEVCDCGDGEDDCSEGDGVFTAMGEEGSVLAGDELVGAILVGRITCIGLELLLMLREFVDVVKVMYEFGCTTTLSNKGMTNVAVVRYFVKKTLRLGSCVLEDRLVPV